MQGLGKGASGSNSVRLSGVEKGLSQETAPGPEGVGLHSGVMGPVNILTRKNGIRYALQEGNC